MVLLGGACKCLSADIVSRVVQPGPMIQGLSIPLPKSSEGSG